jgi:hypothetical protein
MRRDYDVFEKFPDGSTLWRECAAGRYEAQRRIHELKEHSENEFFLIDIQAEWQVPLSFGRANSRPTVHRKRGVGSKPSSRSRNDGANETTWKQGVV